MECCSDDKHFHLKEPIHPEKMSALKTCFAEFDRNNDGFISRDELSGVIDSLGRMIPDDELDEMIKLVDKDLNGLVDFKEFIELMDNNCLVQSADKEMEDLFRVFDLNKDGYITEQEISNIMGSLNEKVRKRDIRKMVKVADRNKDGKISFVEFKEMVNSGKFLG